MHTSDSTCWLKAHFHVVFEAEFPTPLMLVLRPRSDYRQWVAEDRFIVSPDVPITEYMDSHGNRCQRLTVPAGYSDIRGETVARVLQSLPVDPSAGFVDIPRLPDSVISYLLPSRYCESDRLAGLAWEIVGDAAPGYPQVNRICDWVRSNIAYRPGNSNILITAMEVRQRGEGVCRDLAHLGVALCRALSIPARFVSGYLDALEPMDLHAWFEAYVGDDWYAFDATQKQPRGRRLVVALGRDAADVPIFNQFGPLLIPQRLTFSVERLDGPST